MRYLVLSDIHANLEALESVLRDAARRPWDRCLILGDLVGYGADPDAVVERLRDLSPHRIIRGNHDKVACGVADGEAFNPLALAAARWTRDRLRADLRRWLADLPAGPAPADGDDLILAHGSPSDEEAYILGHDDAAASFASRPFWVCLFGHTHYPMVIRAQDRGLLVAYPEADSGAELPLESEGRYLVNPGSVGQPRDGDPRASYVILDTAAGRVAFHRVSYPVELAMAKIVEAGLPAPLAARLSRGV